MSSSQPLLSEPSSLLIEECREIQERLDPEPSHSSQVSRLVLRLFDQLRDLHRLNSHARWIIEAGALLHDIGWSVSGSGHHKHSARLIQEHTWKRATPEQVLQIAALARYHRKAHPAVSHKVFSMLSQENRKETRKMASMLRIADGLDRGHLSRVRNVIVHVEGDRCIMKIESNDSCSIEILAAEKKKEIGRASCRERV